MASFTSYEYIIDNLDKLEKEREFIGALKYNSHIFDVKIDKYQKIVTIFAKKNPKKEMEMACDIVGLNYRTDLKPSIFKYK